MPELQISWLGEDPTQPAHTFEMDSLTPLFNQTGLTHWRKVNQRSAIIRSGNVISGFVLKGLASKTGFDFLNDYIIRGRFPKTDTLGQDEGRVIEVVISDKLANQLQVDTGSALVAYFSLEGLKVRKLIVAGLYHTGIEDFDQSFGFCQKSRLDKLTGLHENQVTALEWEGGPITGQQAQAPRQLNQLLPQELELRTNKQLYPQLFDWLGLIDRNVWVISGVIGAVCLLSITAILMVLVVEHTRRLGIFKTLGAPSSLIFRLFLKMSLGIATRGLILGNLLAAFVFFIQSTWHPLTLPEENYYIANIPLQFDAGWFWGVNFGLVILMLPATFVPYLMAIRQRPTAILAFE